MTVDDTSETIREGKIYSCGERTRKRIWSLCYIQGMNWYLAVRIIQSLLFSEFKTLKIQHGWLAVQVGATSISILRSVWQTYWLHEKWNSLGDAFDQLAQSLKEMEDNFEDFIQQLNRTGWDTQQINLKVPKEISIDELDPIWLHSINTSTEKIF